MVWCGRVARVLMGQWIVGFDDEEGDLGRVEGSWTAAMRVQVGWGR